MRRYFSRKHRPNRKTTQKSVCLDEPDKLTEIPGRTVLTQMSISQHADANTRLQRLCFKHNPNVTGNHLISAL